MNGFVVVRCPTHQLPYVVVLPNGLCVLLPTQICKGANDYAMPSAPELPVERLGEAARKALTRATAAVRRYGWLSFWAQLSLSVVSGVILLFSVAFTSQSGPKASLYLTLFGILAGFLSTFWNFGYTRTAMKMQSYLDAPPGTDVPKIKKQQVGTPCACDWRRVHPRPSAAMQAVAITGCLMSAGRGRVRSAPSSRGSRPSYCTASLYCRSCPLLPLAQAQ